ncbi:SAM domain-containing protein, partial [Ruegeria marina]
MAAVKIQGGNSQGLTALIGIPQTIIVFHMVVEISTWLGSLGLSQYVEAFRENDVDGRVLPL